jgi:hypothetical protein
MARRITIELTPMQARGLFALAGEGAGGLLNDAVAAQAYIGNEAAIRAAEQALDILGRALPPRPKSRRAGGARS